MKKNSIILWLILMILLSLFAGAPADRGWSFIYQFEIIGFLQFLGTSALAYFFQVIILLAHVGIFSLPFFINKGFFRKMLFYFPLVYILGYAVAAYAVLLVLIPFIIVWLIILRKYKQKVNVQE